jgi:hypothetical protein
MQQQNEILFAIPFETQRTEIRATLAAGFCNREYGKRDIFQKSLQALR